ncbi:type IX secretion system membrane protein PorP/SprF [Marinilabiliaceae bacterium JC017]|nr:type IX secretion system membrane protein PorP/SprF [Marinilabiliaceae bacterium JC017]
MAGSMHNVLAQQEPLYTQYMFNTVSVNPAYAGTRDAMNLLFLSRLQWSGLDGAPKTNTFSMHSPLNNYNMGVGFSVVSDKIGPVNNYYINLNYAYRVNLTDKMILSMGIKGGIYNYYVGLNDIPLNENGDPAFAGDLEKRLQPNVGAGLYLYTDKFYVGVSVPKLIQTDIGNEVKSGTSVLGELKRHYFIMGGYVFDLNHEFKLKSSLINKMVEGAPPSTDITAQMIYKDTYWLGATYRVGDAVAFLADIQINKQLIVGYSYDFSVSRLAGYNHGSHEIMISYDFDGFLKKKTKSLRHF